MKAFQFPLERALDWRRTQLEVAEARVQQQLGALTAIDNARVDLGAMGQRAELEVRQFSGLEGGDLSALGEYRLNLKVRARQLAAQRVECQKELAARQTAMLEARRRCRLLERLKARRLSEWQSAADRELDELAADSYLAQWARRGSMSN